MTISIKPFYKDLLITAITEAAVFLSFFLIYRIIAADYGVQGVGEYSLVRRVAGLAQPLLLLGLGVGLTRYIALFYHERHRFMGIACIAVIGFTAIFLTTINLFPDFFALIFFGSVAYSNFIFPLSFFLAGLELHSLVYSYYRGILAVAAFNLLEIFNLAIIPLILIFVFKGAGLANYVLLVGISMAIVSVIFSVKLIKKVISIGGSHLGGAGREMLYYGLSRVLGDFMFNGFFSVTAIAAAHFMTMKQVGYLSVGQGILNILSAVTAPLSLILLPKISRLISQKREQDIKENIDFLLNLLFYISVFISFQFVAFADKFIYFWLGADFAEATTAVRIILACAGFYFIYLVLRNILDAADFRPTNAINVAISFAAFILACLAAFIVFGSSNPLLNLASAFSFGVAILGISTYFSVRKIYKKETLKDAGQIAIAIGINIIIVILAMLFKNLITSLYALVVLEGITGILYLAVLWLLDIGWIKKIPSRLFSASR